MITPRLIYPTKDKRVSAILMIMQGILVKEILPVRISFELIQSLHSRIDVPAARLTFVTSSNKMGIIRIRVL